MSAVVTLFGLTHCRINNISSRSDSTQTQIEATTPRFVASFPSRLRFLTVDTQLPREALDRKCLRSSNERLDYDFNLVSAFCLQH
jgi:hypothetical protein